MMEKRIDGRREKTRTQSNRRQWNEQCDAVWRHSDDLLKNQKFSWKTSSLLGRSGKERKSASHRAMEEKLYRAFSLPPLRAPRPNDCVTSDRSVDELLMRSHFFTLHRRLSKRVRFSVCHQCLLPLCYQHFLHSLSHPTPSLHTIAQAELFLGSRSLPSRLCRKQQLVSGLRENVCTKSYEATFRIAEMEKYRIGVKKFCVLTKLTSQLSTEPATRRSRKIWFV